MSSPDLAGVARLPVGRVGGILTLRGRVAWAHDFNPDRSIAATFEGEFSDISRSYSGKGVVRYAW